jgi:hypothetical protein
VILSNLNPEHRKYRVWDSMQLPVQRVLQYDTETQEAVLMEGVGGGRGVALSPAEVASEFPALLEASEVITLWRVKLIGSYATDPQGNRV